MAERPRKRRWPWFLGVLGALALGAAWWIDRQLEPVRLATTVLDGLGAATGLRLTFEGTPEYALRPEPRLVLQGFDARAPGAVAPMFRADRLEVSLPWDTVWGGPVVITRVALAAPMLDVDAMADWLASRPPSDEPFELPTLVHGLQASDGIVAAAGWRLDGLSLSLPRLAPRQPAEARFTGELTADTLRIGLDGTLALAEAGLVSPLTLRSEGVLAFGELERPYSFFLDSGFDARGGEVLAGLQPLRFTSASPLPDLEARGRLRLGAALSLEARGALARWPADWPALPAPLDPARPLRFSASYAGPTDLSGTLALAVDGEGASASAVLSLPRLLAWLEDPAAAPLPPMQARLHAPALEVEGATLEGVGIELRDRKRLE